MTENPFAAPLTVGGRLDLSQPITVEGDFLVVPTGVSLPHYCVKTGQPIQPQDFKRKTFYSCPPWVVLLIFAGGLFVILGYFVFRKKCELAYGIHPEVRRKYRRRLWIKAALALALFLAIPFMAGFQSTGPITVVSILFVIAIVSMLVGNAPLSIRKHKKGRFWFRGCSREFLARLEQAQPAVPIGMPAG